MFAVTGRVTSRALQTGAGDALCWSYAAGGRHSLGHTKKNAKNGRRKNGNRTHDGRRQIRGHADETVRAMRDSRRSVRLESSRVQHGVFFCWLKRRPRTLGFLPRRRRQNPSQQQQNRTRVAGATSREPGEHKQKGRTAKEGGSANPRRERRITNVRRLHRPPRNAQNEETKEKQT